MVAQSLGTCVGSLVFPCQALDRMHRLCLRGRLSLLACTTWLITCTSDTASNGSSKTQDRCSVRGMDDIVCAHGWIITLAEASAGRNGT